jgi:hypothetical protein
MADKAPSFLATVKQDITTAFAEQYDTLAEVCSDTDVLTTSLKTAQKKVWEIVEKRLKESYLNGRKLGNGKYAEGRKPNPFRKE